MKFVGSSSAARILESFFELGSVLRRGGRQVSWFIVWSSGSRRLGIGGNRGCRGVGCGGLTTPITGASIWIRTKLRNTRGVNFSLVAR